MKFTGEFLVLVSRTVLSFFTTILLLNIGCENEDYEQYSVSIVPVGNLTLKLDSLTTNSISNVSVIEDIDDSSPNIVFQNKGINSILYYDLIDSSNCKLKISFQKEGSNGIGRMDGFYIYNSDSIYIISSYNSKIFLVNRRGEIQKKYVFSADDEDSTSTSMPYSATHTPLIKVEDTLYIGGFPDVEPFLTKYKSKLKLALNTKDGRYKYLHSYPDVYLRNYWGRTHMFFPNVYDSKKSKFIYSFPIADSLYIIGRNRHVNSVQAKSSYIDKIHPMKHFTKNRGELRTYLYNTPIYSNVLVDKVNDVYYRIAEQATEDFDLNQIGKMKRDASIIILDSTFKKIGETLIGDGYRVNHSFTIEGSLFILKEIQNDDFLSFEKFVLIKNNE